MTEYVIVGMEYQNQYVYWDGFESLHTINTSPLLFYQFREGDRNVTCVSEDVELMLD